MNEFNHSIVSFIHDAANTTIPIVKNKHKSGVPWWNKEYNETKRNAMGEFDELSYFGLPRFCMSLYHRHRFFWLWDGSRFESDEEKEVVIDYFSKYLFKAELNYRVTRAELLAVICHLNILSTI